MKLQLDTKLKTIKIEDDVLLSELIEMLEKLLPQNEWKTFKIQTSVTINNWNNPVVYKEIIMEIPSCPQPGWWLVDNLTGGSPRFCNSGTTLGEFNIEY